MNTKEWQTYINTGQVPMHYLKSMVEAIKSGQKLNSKHLAVYTTHAQIIEVMLKSK